MATAGRPHPTLNAMLLCDHTIREQGTGKVSLIGIFENISAARFPVVHHALSVYAKLGDAEGEYAIRLELVRLDDGHTVAQGALRAALPEVQWILTTTSPVVAASCEPREVLALRRLPEQPEVSLFAGDQALTH